MACWFVFNELREIFVKKEFFWLAVFDFLLLPGCPVVLSVKQQRDKVDRVCINPSRWSIHVEDWLKGAMLLHGACSCLG